MSDDVNPTGDAGLRKRQWRILRSTPWTLPLALLGLPALHLWVVPPLAIDALADRIALALRCNAIAILPYFGVCMAIMTMRFFEGAHDPTKHQASAALQIRCRVMQNHLEQFVAFATACLALATTLPAAHLHALPLATAVFVVARLIYGWGYHRHGTLGRAPGVQLTFAVTIPMVFGAIASVLAHALG